MGTRGLLGFVIDGEVKATYNHYDSYPSGLGVDMLDYIANSDMGVAADQARELRLVESEDVPTKEALMHLDALGISPDTNVGNGPSYYQALRQCQGKPGLILKSGYMIDWVAFAADSLFCEWAYLINFDQGVLEVFEGFQKEQHDRGRFSTIYGSNHGY